MNDEMIALGILGFIGAIVFIVVAILYVIAMFKLLAAQKALTKVLNKHEKHHNDIYQQQKQQLNIAKQQLALDNAKLQAVHQKPFPKNPCNAA